MPENVGKFLDNILSKNERKKWPICLWFRRRKMPLKSCKTDARFPRFF